MWTRALLVGLVAVVGLARAAYPSADQYATPRNHHRAAADAPLDKQTPSDKWSGFDAPPDDQDASYELGFGIIDENDNLLEARNSSARRKDDDLFFAYVVEPTLLAGNSEGSSPRKRSSSSTPGNDEPEAIMSLPELLRLWGLDTAEEVATKRAQRGDIEVTERPIARGDVPLAESQPAALSRRGKRDLGRKLLWASDKEGMWGFGEDDGLLQADQPSGESSRDDAYQQTKRPEHHRKHHQNHRENEDRRRGEEEEEEVRRRQEEVRRRQEEERRRQEEERHRQEQQRKGAGNELRKPDDTYDARMQEWYRKKAEHDRQVQEREEARKRPSQTQRPDELDRERKLQDYIRRNTPIRPGQPASSLTDPRRLPYDRKREDECCRRLQEERDNRNNEQVRKAELERRRHEQERRREEQRRRQEEELARRPVSPQGDNRRRHEASKTRPQVDDDSTEQMRRHDGKRPRPDTKTDSKDVARPGSESRMTGNRWRDEENRRRYLEFKRKEESSSSARQPAQPTTKADEDESRKLQSLPVDARIIIRRTEDEANATAAAPLISLRAGGPDEEIDFPGFSPGRRGPQAQHFPAPVTRRPPAKSPAPCVWALVVCCNQQHNDPRRQMRCFEGAACLSWDADRCRKDNVNAANDELLKFYVGQASRTRPKNTIILS